MTDDSGIKQHKKNKITRPIFNWKTMLVIGLFVVVLAGSAYYWFEVRGDSGSGDVTTQSNLEESEQVLESLNQILLTESDKTPTIARIEKPERLRENNEDFYKNAQEGDYLILYPKRAVIFRQSENLIINVVPYINIKNITPTNNEE